MAHYNIEDWLFAPPDKYRKWNLHTPDWPIDVDWDCEHLVSATFGGPIAIVRDPKQAVMARNNIKPIIRIFNSAGTELGKILWQHGKLISMGWSDTEQLLCVQDDALVHVFDMFGNEKDSFTMGKEATITKIVDAKFFASSTGTGIAVMTTNGRVFVRLSNSKDKKVRQLPEIPKSMSDFSCWEMVTEARNSYCLIGREQEVVKLFPGESVGKINSNLFDKPFERIILMSVSYNQQNLALYTNNGLLWLGSVDMKRKFCEFDTGRQEAPHQMEWIMDANANQAEAVAIAYGAQLLLVKRNGEKDAFQYDFNVLLIAEMDGVRVLCYNEHMLIEKLPKCVQNTFGLGSSAAASYLFDAYRKFEEGSYQTSEYLNYCRGKMDVAVNDCIEAASYEWSTEFQKKLFKAAHFGKAFLSNYKPDDYVRIMRILRVLNALRQPNIAMPLTFAQFMHVTPIVVLSRLVYRKHYALAIQIAKHLKMPEAWILEHWAYDKVEHDKHDNDVARKITEKFKNPCIKGISFCNIAEKALTVGRKELALKLLELEPRSALQIPLLLKLGKYDRAIDSATESGDTELIAKVLIEIKTKMMLGNFHMLIREYPLALSYYKKMMMQKSRTALNDIYKTEDDHKAIAENHFQTAIESNSLELDMHLIAESYIKARRSVEAELCTDATKLMKLQKTLKQKLASVHGDINFYGMSTYDTILQLLQLGELKEAEKIRNDFKVPDKIYWWLRVRTLSQKYRWDELEKFAKSKKSPIGYDPFVEVCLNQNNLDEAQKYILKCRDDRKVYWYMRAELYEQAADCAYEQKDIHTLEDLQRKADNINNRLLMDKVNAYIITLNK